MPYNPNSAYPRKTTYIPPTYGDHSFKGAVNANDYSSRNTFGGGPYKPRGGEIFNPVIAAASRAAVHPGAAAGLEAISRKGITDKLAVAGQAAIVRGAGQVGAVAGPMAKAAITGNVTPLVTRGAEAVVNRGLNKVDAIRGTPRIGPGLERKPFTLSHGNPAAIQTRAANVALSDQITGRVLDGSMPGETGAANVPKLILPTTKRK